MRASLIILTLVSLAACSGDLTLPNDGGGGPDGGGPPLPDQVRVVDGDGQRARTGEVLNDPLVVQVVDSGAAPVVGTTVEFSFAGDPAGAVLEPSVTTTDSSGLASVEVRVGTESGEQEIVARVTGTDLSASFTVTATDGRHGHGGDEDH
ncbi:MAG TPA: hypothetical protein VFJ81_08075 [Gemmatimonadales bacterium]|jgi:hypothetical protein|nr:hypothetical protein [Gemmatimonadales bacterium]